MTADRNIFGFLESSIQFGGHICITRKLYYKNSIGMLSVSRDYTFIGSVRTCKNGLDLHNMHSLVNISIVISQNNNTL